MSRSAGSTEGDGSEESISTGTTQPQHQKGRTLLGILCEFYIANTVNLCI